MKDWKLIRSAMDNERLELYDLNNDIHEDENLVKVHPAIVQRMISYMEEAHEPHPNWPTPGKRNNYTLLHGIMHPSFMPCMIFLSAGKALQAY